MSRPQGRRTSSTPRARCAASRPAPSPIRRLKGAAALRSVKTVVVAPQYDNKLFDVAISVQAGDSPSPTYQRDAQTILTGMQIKAPTAP